eukprot:CAMPEP_0175141808 /NCGR_PEP_ID=MMETSP0087-20121206/12358_1 /TAXON_ID=136419 /ORGANISM="Unknown Unknown, Strain D1" /LENGTH=500 /DNA_ID=CAMNT_0016425359 /DNA_START=122 /DNA_END=1624 /DNA_ORIENTATION=+
MVSKITIGGRQACAYNLGNDMKNGGNVKCNSNIKVRSGKPRRPGEAGGCNTEGGPDHCILEGFGGGDPGRDWTNPAYAPSTPCMSGQSFGQSGVMNVNIGDTAVFEVLMNQGGDHGGMHALQMACGANPSHSDFTNNLVTDWHITSQPKDRRGQRVGRTRTQTDRYLDDCGNHCRYNFGTRNFDTLPLSFQVNKCSGQYAVARWIWYGRETNQLYIKCLDLKVGGGGGGSPPAPAPPPSTGGGGGSGGSDIPPNGAPYSCAQQKKWGKCSKSWMQDYCCKSCGHCGSSSSSSSQQCVSPLWGQCAGKDWRGCNKCASDQYCVYYDQYYSQCRTSNSKGFQVADDQVSCSSNDYAGSIEGAKQVCNITNIQPTAVCEIAKFSRECYSAVQQLETCNALIAGNLSVCESVVQETLGLYVHSSLLDGGSADTAPISVGSGEALDCTLPIVIAALGGMVGTLLLILLWRCVQKNPDFGTKAVSTRSRMSSDPSPAFAAVSQQDA